MISINKLSVAAVAAVLLTIAVVSCGPATDTAACDGSAPAPIPCTFDIDATAFDQTSIYKTCSDLALPEVWWCPDQRAVPQGCSWAGRGYNWCCPTGHDL